MATPIELVFLLGRVIFGGFFVWNGIQHVRNRAALAQYAASHRVPAPNAAVLGTGALLLLGGASIVLGFLPLVGLAFVALFLVGVTPAMHAFWRLEDPMARMGETVNFTKNLALLGAALALTIVPEPWALSLGAV